MKNKYVPPLLSSLMSFEFLFLFGEVFFTFLHTWFDRVRAWFPASWADLSVLVGELESLHKPQSLIYRSSNRQVIHCYLSQCSFVINNKQTPEGDTLIFGNLFSDICKNWDLHFS